jgi:dTDP-4-dehydrorhamnose reductase
MKALIIGATGATGKDLVNVLIRDPDYSAIVIFMRRSTGIIHPKLKEVITDFENLQDVSDHIHGDILFSCLGTTLKTAGSKEKQFHIDYEIPLQFAEIARRNGVPKMVLLSSYGASTTSKVFYSRVKGKLEQSTDNLAFDQYVIFRPGMLLRKNTDRPAERVLVKALNLLNRLSIAKKFRPLPTSILAEKMAKAPKVFPAGKHIVELQKIFDF